MSYYDYYEMLARDYYREKYGREPTRDEIISYIADVYASHVGVDYDVAVEVVRRVYEKR